MAQRLSAYAAQQQTLDRSHYLAAECIAYAQFDEAQTPLRRLAEWKTGAATGFKFDLAHTHSVEETLVTQWVEWLTLIADGVEETEGWDNFDLDDWANWHYDDPNWTDVLTAIGQQIREHRMPSHMPIAIISGMLERDWCLDADTLQDNNVRGPCGVVGFPKIVLALICGFHTMNNPAVNPVPQDMAVMVGATPEEFGLHDPPESGVSWLLARNPMVPGAPGFEQNAWNHNNQQHPFHSQVVAFHHFLAEARRGEPGVGACELFEIDETRPDWRVKLRTWPRRGGPFTPVALAVEPVAPCILYLAEIGQQKQLSGEVGVIFPEPPPMFIDELAGLTVLTLQASFDHFTAQPKLRFDAGFLLLPGPHFNVPPHLEASYVTKWSQFLTAALGLRLPWLEIMCATLDGTQLVLSGYRRARNPPRTGGPYIGGHSPPCRRGNPGVFRQSHQPTPIPERAPEKWRDQICLGAQHITQRLWWVRVKATARMEIWWWSLRFGIFSSTGIEEYLPAQQVPKVPGQDDMKIFAYRRGRDPMSPAYHSSGNNNVPPPQEDTLFRQDGLCPIGWLLHGISAGKVSLDFVPTMILGRDDEHGIWCSPVLLQNEADGPWSGASVDFIVESNVVGAWLGRRRSVAVVPLGGMLEGNAYRQWVVSTTDNAQAFARTFGGIVEPLAASTVDTQDALLGMSNEDALQAGLAAALQAGGGKKAE